MSSYHDEICHIKHKSYGDLLIVFSTHQYINSFLSDMGLCDISYPFQLT